jgi:hypothetical protein
MMTLAGLNRSLRPYAEQAYRIAHYNRIFPVTTSVSRSMGEQRFLRQRYERCLGRYGRVGADLPAGCRYPANRPGDSAHNWGLAWDSWVPPEQMAIWVAIRRDLGFRVPDHDRIHAELPNWRAYVPSVPRYAA